MEPKDEKAALLEQARDDLLLAEGDFEYQKTHMYRDGDPSWVDDDLLARHRARLREARQRVKDLEQEIPQQ